jgi:hypothetical protein
MIRSALPEEAATLTELVNAEGFYVSMGAALVRRISSSIAGRSIPYFEMDLDNG